jgi:hypothetical protein
MIKTIVAVFLTALLLVSLQSCKQQTQKLPLVELNFLKLKAGKEVIEVLQNPDSIHFAYVNPKRSAPHYALISPEILLANGENSELQDLLLNDNHYVKELNKLTMFMPTMAFKFHKENKEDIIVLLSPVGDQLNIIDKENDIILDYDPAKIVFDNFIQKLENKYPQ